MALPSPQCVLSVAQRPTSAAAGFAAVSCGDRFGLNRTPFASRRGLRFRAPFHLYPIVIRRPLAQRQPRHYSSAEIDQRMEGDRRPERIESRHDQREDRANNRRAENAIPSLIDMRNREKWEGQRRGAPPTEPRGEGSDEVAAVQKLLAEPRGQRHAAEPIQFGPRVRYDGGERS